MSSPLAIATVTAILKDLLNDGLINSNVSSNLGGGFKVTASPPDRIAADSQEPNQLNLFLYRVTPNQGWRNEGLPSRTSSGEMRISSPPLAIDLHYLLTAYGADDLNAEILLGYAMQLFHEEPVLTRQAIRRAFNPNAPVSDKLLPTEVEDRNPADLADQVELIKICPEYLNTEDLSKLWTAMQARYRPSMGYQVSVVLIERARPVRAPLPVLERRVFVDVFSHPTIERVEPPIAANDKELVLRGQNLRTRTTRVRFAAKPGDAAVGGAKIPQDILVDPEPVDPNAPQNVVVKIPDTLHAGVRTVQIIQEISSLDKQYKDSHRNVGFESNIAAFVLAPRITQPPKATVFRGGVITLTISPGVGIEQRVALLLNNVDDPVNDWAIRLPPRDLNIPGSVADLEFPVPEDFSPGTYLLHIQVDGANSALLVETAVESPDYGKYVGPKVTIE